MLRRNLKSPERNWELRCNHCRQTTTFGGGVQFQLILDWLRENGWKARSHSQIWEHVCPPCLEAELDARVDRDRLHA